MIITKTPLRISLLGGNTDFPKYFKKYGGAVLTTTIDKYIYCIVKKREFDKQIWINYSQKEIVNNVKDIKHDLVRECLRYVGIKDSIEITFLSDIPSEGSGLGSSSAVTIGLLNALYRYQGVKASDVMLATDACKIEVDILKKPIGYQDQWAIALGGLKVIVFGKDEVISFIEYNPSFLRYSLMLFYTGITRKAETILSKMKLNKKILDQNKELALRNYGISGKIGVGNALDDYWQLKKKLNPLTSNEFIDKKYSAAISAGAYGGKIVGAGGGGFLLFMVPVNKKGAVRKAIGLQELPFKIEKKGSKVIYG